MTITFGKIFSSWLGGAASRSRVDGGGQELPVGGLELKKPLGVLERLTRFVASIKNFVWGEKPERNAEIGTKTILVGVRKSLQTSNDELDHGVTSGTAPVPLSLAERRAEEADRHASADKPPALPSSEAHPPALPSKALPEAPAEPAAQVDREEVIDNFLKGHPTVVTDRSVATFIKRITQDLCSRSGFDPQQPSHIEDAARQALDFYKDLKESSRMGISDFGKLVNKALEKQRFDEDHELMEVAGSNVIYHHLMGLIRHHDHYNYTLAGVSDEDRKAATVRVATQLAGNWRAKAKELGCSEPLRISEYLKKLKVSALPQALVAEHLTTLLLDSPQSPLLMRHPRLTDEERTEIASRVANDLSIERVAWAAHLGCDEPFSVANYLDALQDGETLNQVVDLAVGQHDKPR